MRGNKITALERQSIWDIALQEYGSTDGVFQLIKDNPGLELDTILVPGQKLFIVSTPIDEQVVSAYRRINHQPSGPLIKQLIRNKYDPSDTGGWSGNINADYEAFNFLGHVDKKGRHYIDGLVPGKAYLVAIHFMEIWPPVSAGQKISVELGKDSNGSDGTMEVGASKELDTPGRYEFILTADDAGAFLFVKGLSGIECRFKDVSLISIN